MKQYMFGLFAVLSIFSTPLSAKANAWFECGSLNQIAGCQLADYPSVRYEYGISYNTSEPLPAVCTYWNVGMRVANKEPYFVHSDDPTSGMRRGGFVFYRDTYAPDDDTCSRMTPWRHRYWSITADGGVETGWSNGCFGSTITIFCRLR